LKKPLKSSRCGSYGFDGDAVNALRFPMGRHKCDLVARASQRLTLFMKDADVKRRMRRREDACLDGHG
jgi:hypothetical protein